MSAQLVEEPSVDEVLSAASTLKLLADPTRLRIVWTLLHGEHSVNQLAEHVGMRPPAVSQHLAKLRAGGVVSSRRDGNRIFYSAADHHIARLAEEAIFHTDYQRGLGAHGAMPVRTSTA